MTAGASSSGLSSGLHADAVRVLASWAAPDADQERLRTSYLDHLRRHPDGVYRSCLPAHVTASALVVDADGQRVLLALHRKGGFWGQLGGHCEDGDDSLVAAALREAAEESGIEGLRVVGPHAGAPTDAPAMPIDVDRHRLSGAFGSCGEHLDVRYLLIAPSGAEPVTSDESDDVRWFGWDAMPPGAVDDLERLLRRARAAMVGAGASDQSSQPSSASAPSSSPAAAATPSR